MTSNKIQSVKFLIENAETVTSNQRYLNRANHRIEKKFILRNIELGFQDLVNFYFGEAMTGDCEFQKEFDRLSGEKPDATKETIFKKILESHSSLQFIKKERDELLQNVVLGTIYTHPLYQSENGIAIGLFKFPEMKKRKGIKSPAACLPSYANSFTMSFIGSKERRGRVVEVADEGNVEDDSEDDEEEEGGEADPEFKSTYKMLDYPENCKAEAEAVARGVTKFLRMNEEERKAYCRDIALNSKSSPPENFGLFYSWENNFKVICYGQRYKITAGKCYYPQQLQVLFIEKAKEWARRRGINVNEEDRNIPTEDEEGENDDGEDGGETRMGGRKSNRNQEVYHCH